ncbi:MAG TPA: capsule assembly Wzi family protein, partial [Bryobacteraceae bacterium]
NPRSYFSGGCSRRTQREVTVAGAPLQVWRDQKHIWTSPLRLKTRDLEWILPLSAATGLLIATDHHTMTLIHGDAKNESRSSTISNAGLAAFAGVGAIAYGVGAFARDEHARETGILIGQALTDTFLVTEALKFISQRSRPAVNNAQGLFGQGSSLNSSFPSEHAALAWTAATVFAREYPGPVTQWTAYGLASLVSLSRMTAYQHFPSDVLIGAAAGYLIGRYVYHTHHDDRMTDRTGATPARPAKSFASVTPKTGHTAPSGSVYVPLDSWIYPALRRLADWGFIPDQVSGQAPWTRAECLRQVEQAADLASYRADSNSPVRQDAFRLISDLRSALTPESETDNMIRLESVYSRFTSIAGRPLRDGYHFGTTIANDFGRPYDEGFNYVTGFSSYAVSGRLSAYVRGEYDSAPGRDADSLSVRRFISSSDGIPLPGPQNVPSINHFKPLEMYAGVQLGFENITFGKQSLWWGPDSESAFSFSNNAAPFYMLRFAQTRPITLPGPFRLLGKIRTDVIFGKLSGHQWPARPYINAQKISLDLTDNFEVGFTRAAIFGGVGHPLTLGSLKASLFSTSSVDFGPYGSPDLPGDRFSNFDFRWRVPGVRRYLTVYSDSYADDDPSPIDNPKRSAWAPGLYITRLPGLPRLDFRFETYATWLYRKDQGGNFLYWDNQYRDANTNNGNVFGSWVGRDARAYTAQTTYWFSARSKIIGNYRQIKSSSRFLPGGGTQTDISVAAYWGIGREWQMSAQVQGERYYVPLLGTPRRDALTSIGLTYSPEHLAVH